MRLAVEEERVKALDRVVMATRLLDSRIYPDISKAVKDEDKRAFKRLCTKADIPADMADDMWKLIRYESREDLHPCW